MHIFAISGLHVACIGMCVLFVLQMLGMPRDRASLLLIPLVWFYTLATGWQSSAIRSALMSSFVFAGWKLRRPTEVVNSTAAAALCILIFSPEQLFQPGFQLSFAVVLALGLLLEHSGAPWPVQLQTWVQEKVLRYDPLLPRELVPRWKRICELPIAFVLGNFAVSLAAWVGALPVSAWYFNTITPVSLLANLVAVPLSSLALAASLGSLLLPPLGVIFNFASWAFMWETIAFAKWCASLPLGYFYVPKPTFWFFMVYFAGIAVLLVHGIRATRWKWAALALLAVSGVAFTREVGVSTHETRLTMLPAAGNPVYVDRPGRAEDCLIDCSSARDAELLLKRFLRAQGVGSLQSLILTHADASHAGGFEYIVNEFAPGALFLNPARVRSKARKDVEYVLQWHRGQSLPLAYGESACGWRVIHPARPADFRKGADTALVLRGELHGWTLLHLSDLSAAGQRALLQNTSDLHADLLLTGRAGDDLTLDPDLLAAVRPRLIVLGVTARPFRQTVSKPVRALSGVPVICTREEGAVTLTLNPKECRVQTAEGHELFLPAQSLR